jgi:hypothetical protein
MAGGLVTPVCVECTQKYPRDEGRRYELRGTSTFAVVEKPQ